VAGPDDRVGLDGDDASLVKHMVEHLCSHQYPHFEDRVMEARLYGLATKYEIENLRLAVIDNFRYCTTPANFI